MDTRSIGFVDLVLYIIQKISSKQKADRKSGYNRVIVGAYDGCNVGDMALKLASRMITDAYNESHEELVKGEFKHSSLSDKKNIVYGGGATFTLEEAKKISSSDVEPKKVSLLGVDVQGAKNKYDKVITSFLKNTDWISVRQKRQKKILEKEIDHVKWHPDISFLLKDMFQEKRNKGVIGVNVIPFMSRRRKLRWVENYPWSNLSNKNSKDLKRDANVKSKKYVEIMRLLVKQALSRGYKVWHHPFTPADYLFASSIFDGLDVEHHTYSPDVKTNIRRFEKYSKMIATRLHSHIFAIMSEIPLISFAYSRKCYSLFEDIDGFGYDKQLGRRNISKKDLNEIDIENMWYDTSKMADAAHKVVKNKTSKFGL